MFNIILLVILFIDFKNNIATFFLYINKNYHCTVTFNFKNIDYPFIGPQVFINNYSYLSILKTDTKSFKKNITSVNCCLYCESILCYDNWRATFTMKHILDEIYDNLILKLRMNEIRHCRKIVEKCLPYSGKSLRIGLTGTPGVGNCTLIDSFGKVINTLFILR